MRIDIADIFCGCYVVAKLWTSQHSNYCARHRGSLVVVFAHRAPTTTTLSEAPCLCLEVVALQRLKTTTSGIQMPKRLGVPVVVSHNRM